MSHLYSTAISCAAGLIAGNFLYEAITGRDWEAAFSRCWFQLIAIGIVVWRLQVTS